MGNAQVLGMSVTSERKAAPLRAAEDAHHIDSSALSVEEVIASLLPSPGCQLTLQKKKERF